MKTGGILFFGGVVLLVLGVLMLFGSTVGPFIYTLF